MSRIFRGSHRLATKLSVGATLAAAGTLAGATALALPASSVARAKKVTLIGSGSSAAQPYMLELFRAYSRIHPNVRFIYNPDGGNAGVTDVQQGKSQFAIQTALPTAIDAGTVFNKLFLDALCIDVNNANHLSSTSLSDVKNVFTGVDTNWNQLSGSNLSTTIDPFGRNSSSGQYTFFKSAVLGGQTQGSVVQQESSDGLVAKAVEQDANGIGYVGLANARQPGEHALTVGGYSCTAPNIKSQKYPLYRYDWGVLPQKNPSVAVEQFFDWVRTNHTAGGIINAAGAVAAFNR